MNETKLSSGLSGASGLPDWVRRACMRYVQNRDEADDLAQEVLIKVFRGGDASIERAWLIRVTANHCLDHLRKQKRERLRRAAYAVDPALERRPEDEPGGDLLEALRERLNETDRKLLHLRFDLGLTHADIAEILGVTRPRVGQRLARILALGNRLHRARRAWAARTRTEVPEMRPIPGARDAKKAGALRPGFSKAADGV